MKFFAMLLVSSAFATSAFAVKPDLTCVADDLSPVGITVTKTPKGMQVTGKVNKKVQPVLKATGTLTSDKIDLKLGAQGGSVVGNGFGGIYGVLSVTVPEYNIHAIRMTCFSETLDR